MLRVLFFMLLSFSFAFSAELIKEKESVIDAQNHLQWQDSLEVEEYSDIWKMAKSHCNSLSLLGYHDWRLPTKQELMALSKSKEAKAKFYHLKDEIFWTSQEDKSDDIYAVTVYTGNGFVSSTDKCEKENVVCVRSLP